MKKYLLLVCALSCIVFAKAKDWTQYVNPLMGSQSSFELSTGLKSAPLDIDRVRFSHVMDSFGLMITDNSLLCP